MTSAAHKSNPKPRRPETPLDRLAGLVAEDMRLVNALIEERIVSGVPLIPQLAAHLISAGGKRFRPMLTLAAARLCGYEGENHAKLAATVEFIHTATLLHDDVVDGSEQRRGKKAANILYGNKPTVLVGDFLFSRSFQLMVETDSIRVLGILADASAVIAEGEVMQLATANNLKTTEDQHLAVIRAKTAALFAAATEVGGVIAGQDDAACAALRVYGDRLGVAFQLADDALDYDGDALKLGKNVGDDFREGKVTTPVLLAYARASESDKGFWRRVIEKREQTEDDLQTALGLMAECDAISDTRRQARAYGDEAKAALEIFPDGPIRAAMRDVVDFCIDRTV